MSIKSNSSTPERLLPNTRDWDMGFPDHKQRYEFASKFCIDKTVLDTACGVGYGANILIQNGAKFVQAIDISDEAITIARNNFPDQQISFCIDDCEIISSISQKVQSIVALECLEHFSAPEKFLSRCVELLENSGTLILSTPNVKALRRFYNTKPQNPYHVHEYTYQELSNFLNSYFNEITFHFQVKSPFLELHEDITRFVNFSFRASPFYKLRLRLRYLFKRPSLDPFIRPYLPSFEDFEISPTISDPDRAWVFIVVCKRPKTSK